MIPGVSFGCPHLELRWKFPFPYEKLDLLPKESLETFKVEVPATSAVIHLWRMINEIRARLKGGVHTLRIGAALLPLFLLSALECPLPQRMWSQSLCIESLVTIVLGNTSGVHMGLDSK